MSKGIILLLRICGKSTCETEFLILYVSFLQMINGLPLRFDYLRKIMNVNKPK